MSDISNNENIYASWPKDKNTWGLSSSYPPIPTSPPPIIISRKKIELLPPPIINRENKPEIYEFKKGYIEKSY